MAVSWLRRRRPRCAFVLGGGGNLGAVQVGMLKAVLERGVVPDLVVGCSVGAVNGAALAGDPTLAGVERLAEVWRNLDGDAVFPTGPLGGIRLLRRGTAVASNEGLARLLDGLGYERIEDAAVALHVVATSLRTGRARWFSSGPVREAVLASAALPGIFPPVEVDGELLIDGGVVDLVPMGRALALGADRLFVFHVGAHRQPRAEHRRPIDVVLSALAIARNHRFLAEVDNLPAGVEAVVFPAVDPGNLRPHDFRRSAELIERGYEAAASHLDALAAGEGASRVRAR
jgi:NTE family protein